MCIFFDFWNPAGHLALFQVMMYILMHGYTHFLCFDIVQILYTAFLECSIGAFSKNFLEFQKNICICYLKWKSVFTWNCFNLISHYVNFGTQFNILLLFRWHWYLVYIFLIRFYRAVFRKYLKLRFFDFENLSWLETFFNYISHCASHDSTYFYLLMAYYF